MKRIGLITLAMGLFAFVQAGQIPWTKNPRLTWTAGDSECPTIAVAPSGHLHVVWFDRTPGNYEIYYKKSTDRGATWSPSRRLTWTSGDSWSPAIALDSSGNPYVVWHEYMLGNSEIYFKKSTDGGATWTMGKRLTNNAGWSFSPDIAAYSSGHLHVVWSDPTPGVNEIYYTRSTDGGANWTTAKRLTWTAGWSYAPDIAVDLSGNPHVVWYDDTPGNNEIYYTRSTDGGANWTTNNRLSWNSGTSRNPAITVDPSGYLNVVWDDNTPGNYEIYYKRSVDGGANWCASMRLSQTSGASASPDIVVDSLGCLHVVWYDDTPGNYEIYYTSWEFMVPLLNSFSVK